MSSVSNSVIIRRSIEDVFAVVTDVELTGRWFPGNVEEHWTSPSPHGLGSTRRAYVRMFGLRTQNDAEVTAFKPPRKAVLEGRSPNAPFVVTLEFGKAGVATRLDVTSEIRLRGAARLAGPLIAAFYGRSWARGLENLKRLMESGRL